MRVLCVQCRKKEPTGVLAFDTALVVFPLEEYRGEVGRWNRTVDSGNGQSG